MWRIILIGGIVIFVVIGILMLLVMIGAAKLENDWYEWMEAEHRKQAERKE
jgi:hypothetical protein